MMNKGPLICCTIDDEKCKIVSEIIPLFNTKLIPRAKPMIKDTPTKLEAPLTNASTVPFRLTHIFLFSNEHDDNGKD